MSKRPSFDPEVLERNRPSQSLNPFDYMKPMQEEPAVTETAPAATIASDSTRTLERESVSMTAPAPAAERPLYLPSVDTSEKPFNRGFHMYPSRHEQLLELAHYEQRKPWEIVEQALAEYVKRHYGGKAGK